LQADGALQLQPEALRAACQAVHYPSWRDRLLHPVTTVQLLLLQILPGNTACQHFPHLSGLRFSASAYCQARATLPQQVLEHLLTPLGRAAQATRHEEGRWQGHRTFLRDGSGCSMPDTAPLPDAFGQPSHQHPGCGFPVVHLLALVHAGTGLLMPLIRAPLHTHELSQVRRLHPALQPGDVLVADRGLSSYAHIALAVQGDLQVVFRVGARQSVDFTPHRPFVMPGTRRTPQSKGGPRARWLTAQGTADQHVEWFKPKICPAWLDPQRFDALPASLKLRELRSQVTPSGFRSRHLTLVTTLLAAAWYPKDELAELYFTRWEAETHLAQLQTTMTMDIFHCKTVPGVLKELLVFAIISNLVRLVMVQSAHRQGVAVDCISFIDALRWLGALQTTVPVAGLIVNPTRPHRFEPRVKKRRPQNHPFMVIPRHELRQRLKRQAVEA
jgi:hypothetical protein